MPGLTINNRLPVPVKNKPQKHCSLIFTFNLHLVVGTFKANNPVNTFLLFIYGLFLKFSYFSLSAIPIPKRNDGVLYKFLLVAVQAISGNSSFIYSLITYLLLFTQALWFNRIINGQRLIQQPTYLPAMSYLLITSLFPEWNILSSTLIVNSLLIWVWFKANGLYNSVSPKATLFNIGIVIGISSLFYFPSLGFALVIVFALILNRPFNLAEWVIALVGIIAPYYYLFVWLILSGSYKFFKFPAPVIGYPLFHKNYWQWLTITLVVAAFLTGAWFLRKNFRKQVLQIRKSWNIILFYLLIAILISLVSDIYSFQTWIITAVPLSAFIACAFLYPSKRWFPLLLHWLMVAFVMVTCYFYK